MKIAVLSGTVLKGWYYARSSMDGSDIQAIRWSFAPAHRPTTANCMYDQQFVTSGIHHRPVSPDTSGGLYGVLLRFS